jgi:putative chitinase
MQLNAAIVASGCGATVLRAEQWTAPLQAACDKYSITAPLDLAAFLATVGVESGRLTATVENLNYSAAGLLSTFAKYFDAASAARYERQPQRIANRVYGNRYGNGDESTGDGWKYRGRGLIGITFHDNYAACGNALGLNLIAHPEQLEQPANAALSAAWFWSTHGINELADDGDFLAVSRAVNLGNPHSKAMPNGYSERLALYGAAKKALNA